MKKLAPFVWLLALAGWLFFIPPTQAAEVVKVGSKNFTESVILGEMLAHLLRHAGFRAQHKADLFGSTVAFNALKAGEIDVYVEYTGTLTHELLSGKNIRDDEGLRKELAYLGIVLGGQLGFTDNYALGMREEVAQSKNIRKISELVHHPKMRFGLSDEFMGRQDGWPTLKAQYGLPQNPQGLSHELALRGVVSGKLDVTDLYTTDPQIKQYQLRVLEDDRGILPVQKAVLLWRADLVERAPVAVEAIQKIEGKISTEAMIEMNSRVQLKEATATRTAADFLEGTFGMTIQLPKEASKWQRLAYTIWICTLQHLLLVSISLTVAILISVPLGIAAYRHTKLGGIIMGTVGVIQTIPSMALLVFLIPFLGLGLYPALVALLLYSLLPIVRNTSNGLSEIPPALRESAEVIGLPAWARLWRIELPLASRSILAGIKTAAVINVGTATIGAIIGAGGYGQPILTGIRLDDLPTILSGAIPAALMALLVQQMFGWLEVFVVPRGLRMT